MSELPKVHHAYDPPFDVGIDCGGMEASMTRQSEAEACDVNLIVARAQRSGLLPTADMGSFFDVTVVPDYRGALEQVQAADEAFAALPAHVRSRFENDPGQFVEFMQDPDKNFDEAIKLGLAVPRKAEGGPLAERRSEEAKPLARGMVERRKVPAKPGA